MPPDPVAALFAGADDARPAFEFVRWRGGEEVTAHWTRAAFLARAAQTAGAVMEATAPGDRVVVATPPGPDFAAIVIGCLGAGRIAVPAPTPTTARTRAHVAAIAAAADARLVLTSAPEAAPAPLVPPAADATAYLQFTSGSTRAPRGAVITAGALGANLAAIGDAWRLGPADRGVFWLPPFHDMGLVGALMAPLAFGFPATLMHPAAFLQRPARWLDLIASRRATFSGAPNFAYDLCVDRMTAEEIARLDLSAWRVAVNGAEPVRPATIDRFAAAFAPAGFCAEAFMPGYGLAESVLFVTARRCGDGPVRIVDGVVSCGVPAADTAVRIVDETTGREVADGERGAVWVCGPSTARGYWGGVDAEVFADGWLRTGDIGFLNDGALFVCGRAKDVIIRHGRNLLAGDVEAAIAARTRGRGQTAAFEHEGRLVVVHEVAAGESASAAQSAIVEALGAEFETLADAIVLAAPGAVRLTTSGKVQRAATRDAWAAGVLAPAFAA